MFCFFLDIISQYPTLWTEQVRSRQNNRTRAPCELKKKIFFFPLMMAIGCLKTSTESMLCVFPACVSNHGLRLFLSFKDRWWVVKPVHLGVGVQYGFEDLLLCGSLQCSISVIISTWHKHRMFYSFSCTTLLFC